MAENFSIRDSIFMDRALQLAERGQFTTTPNPSVGCVIVTKSRAIAEGHTQPIGKNHAEKQALADAHSRQIDVSGATAYVTLEPCSHFGKTPPCADALIDAGIARVVVAMQDPNPLVAGRGIEKLRAADIQVDCGLRAGPAAELIIGFVSRMTRGRPWVRSKIACSLDGKTALANGQSQWITGPQARIDGHRWRARSCAVLTGIGTVIDDNPRLTVRDTAGLAVKMRQPLRVIVDSDLRTSPDAAVLAGGALIFCATSDAARKAALEVCGAEIIDLPNSEGKVDLAKMMDALAAKGINEVLVEAGARLNGALLDVGLIDELLIYQAPLILGDSARGMFTGKALPALGDASRWQVMEQRVICDDGFRRLRSTDHR